jgi:hypothetical protein
VHPLPNCTAHDKEQNREKTIHKAWTSLGASAILFLLVGSNVTFSL